MLLSVICWRADLRVIQVKIILTLLLMLERFTFSFREQLLIFFFQKQYSVYVQWLPEWCWYIWICYTFKYLTSECPSGIATDCCLSVIDKSLIVFVFSDCSSGVASDPFPTLPTDLAALLKFKIRRRKGNKKILWTFKIDPREEGKDRKTMWTFKMDPREVGQDRKTMWTFKIYPIPSESSIYKRCTCWTNNILGDSLHLNKQRLKIQRQRQRCNCWTSNFLASQLQILKIQKLSFGAVFNFNPLNLCETLQNNPDKEKQDCFSGLSNN